MCGATAAENTGFVEVPLVQALAEPCKAAGKPRRRCSSTTTTPTASRPILAGRADTYINDVNTVDQAVKAYPDKLAKAAAVTLPYFIGIAVPKGKTEFRDAIVAALTALQDAGVETALLTKWSLDAGTLEAPRLVTE